MLGMGLAMKVRITIDVDLSEFEHFTTLEDGERFAREMLINPARARALAALHEVRKDEEADLDVKAIAMAEHLLKIKATLMAEANLRVSPLPSSAEIGSELPFEKKSREDA